MRMRRVAGKIYRNLTGLLGGRPGAPRPPKPQRFEGTPRGLSLESLDRISREVLGSPVRSVAYEHISSWKASGSFRILLTSPQGREKSVIFKNAIYDTAHAPAVEGLPLRPGPPEYSVYANAIGSLEELLPKIYESSEISPGQHFTYLMEDVSSEYVRARQPSAVLGIAGRLPAIHEVLDQWSRDIQPPYLLTYDQEASLKLQDYTRSRLEEYARKHKDNFVAEVLRRWPQISKIHADMGAHPHSCAGVIHGDFGPSNIMVREESHRGVKLIDWEWAGVGPRHGDLASLLKGVARDVEVEALKAYAGRDPRLSLDEHERCYRWCRLERGLLDAGYVAAQCVRAEAETRLNLPSFISGAARRILRSCKELASA